MNTDKINKKNTDEHKTRVSGERLLFEMMCDQVVNLSIVEN